MKKSLMSFFGLFAALVLFAGVALAAGQIEGGNIYRVRNVSTNGSFTDPATGTCNNTFQFRVRVHNPGPDPLANVNVMATLPSTTSASHSSQVTISSSDANPTSVTDTAGITLDQAAKLNYIGGSTQLLDPNGTVLSTLPDTILTSGVNIGTVGVSVQQLRFVQFQVNAECTTPPAQITVCEIATKKIVTINENQFDSAKYTRDLSVCSESATPPTPTKPTVVLASALPNTGPEGVAFAAAAASGLGAAGYQLYLRRRK